MFKYDPQLWHIIARNTSKHTAVAFEAYFEELPTPNELADIICITADQLHSITNINEFVYKSTQQSFIEIEKQAVAFTELANAIKHSVFPSRELKRLGCAHIDLSVGRLSLIRMGVWRRGE